MIAGNNNAIIARNCWPKQNSF